MHRIFDITILLALLCHHFSECIYIQPSQIPEKSGCIKFPALPDPDQTGPPEMKDKVYSAVYEFVNKSSVQDKLSLGLSPAQPVLFKENFDGDDKIYSFEISAFGESTTQIEMDSTKQVYSILENDNPVLGNRLICETQVPSSSMKFLKGPTRLSIHGNHTYYLQQFLSISPKFSQGYFGTMQKEGNERGLEADQWGYCLENYMVGVSIFWSKKDLTKGIKTQSPLWIEVRFPNVNHSEVINIFEFKRDEISKSSLRTPPGVYCPGRKSIQDKSLPFNWKKMSAFYFKAELIKPQTKEVTWANHWYDFNYNLRRIDHSVNVYDPVLGTNTVNAITDIIQYDIGYGYTLNRTTGECRIQDISAMPNYGIFLSIHTRDFAQPQFLFGFENQKYIYIGKGEIRGIECDVYQTLRTGIPVNTESSSVSVAEIYVATHRVPVPVAMILSPYNNTSTIFLPGQSYIYYFYGWHDYDMKEPDADPYDVTTCYPDDNKEDLILKLDVPVSNDTLADIAALIHMPLFLFKLREKIYLMSRSLELLQVANVRCYINTDSYSVYTTFTILGRHPNMTRIKATPSLTESLKIFQGNINSNHFFFDIVHQGKTMRVSAKPNSLKSLLGFKLPTAPVATTTKWTTQSQRTTQIKRTTPKITTQPPPITHSTVAKSTRSTKRTTAKHTTLSTTQVSLSTTPKTAKLKTTTKKHFSPGTLGGAAVGSLLGGFTIGGILTFVQIKFMNGKAFGFKVI